MPFQSPPFLVGDLPTQLFVLFCPFLFRTAFWVPSNVSCASNAAKAVANASRTSFVRHSLLSLLFGSLPFLPLPFYVLSSRLQTAHRLRHPARILFVIFFVISPHFGAGTPSPPQSSKKAKQRADPRSLPFSSALIKQAARARCAAKRHLYPRACARALTHVPASCHHHHHPLQRVLFCRFRGINTSTLKRMQRRVSCVF